MDMSENNYAVKCLLKMFLAEDEVLMEVKTLLRNYQCDVFNFVDLLLIFAMGWALCGRPQPEHESMTPLMSFSPLNV